jgi:hypothetical protein
MRKIRISDNLCGRLNPYGFENSYRFENQMLAYKKSPQRVAEGIFYDSQTKKLCDFVSFKHNVYFPAAGVVFF